MVSKIGCGMQLRIRIEVDTQRSIVRSLVNGDRKIRNRPKGEVVRKT